MDDTERDMAFLECLLNAGQVVALEMRNEESQTVAQRLEVIATFS